MPYPQKAKNAPAGRPLFLLGLSGIVGLVAFLAYSSIEKYLDARATIVTQTAEDARLFREYAHRTFQAVDMALEEVIRTVGMRPWPEVAASRNDWHRLRKIADALPPLRFDLAGRPERIHAPVQRALADAHAGRDRP